MRDQLPPTGLFEYGPDDRVFDSLILFGGALVLLIALLGRGVVTVTLAAGYLGAFLSYLLYKFREQQTSY